MIDLAYIRDHAEEVREALKALNTSAPLDEILALDARRRTLLSRAEELRAERNRVSKEIPHVADRAQRQALIGAMKQVGDQISEVEQALTPVQQRLDAALLEMPNLPDPSVPIGPDETANVVIRHEGAIPTWLFPPQPHWDLGERLGILDMARGVKISGTRFYLLKGIGARLQRAIITMMLDVHTREHGYTEVYPPYMVRADCLVGTAQLPKFADNLYRDVQDDLWMVPTAEVPVTNMYRDEILAERDLPIYHVAYTACFRREQMSAGKDTRGIKRGHQFDKVELVKFVKPETSMHELDTLIAAAEAICKRLELPYRIVQMCTGDLSFSAAIKYDIEVWAAGCGEWLEVSSCSSFKDFQARRANIRYRPADGGRPQFVHTLNGSGLALPRVMIAVLENYQREDGTIAIPVALQPYMGGVETIG